MKNFFWPIFENLMKIVVSHEFYVSKFTLLMTKKNRDFFWEILKKYSQINLFPSSTSNIYQNFKEPPFFSLCYYAIYQISNLEY